MSAMPLARARKPKLEDLVQEFRHYTKNWTKRVNLAEQDEIANIAAREVFEELLSNTLLPPPQPNKSLSQHIHDFMTNHLHVGLSLRDLGNHLGYSEKYCSELFHAHMGKPFSLYLKRLRLQKAKHLLQRRQVSMTEIAAAIGFHDQFAFSHFFKKSTGYSPKHFKELRIQ